MIRVIQNRNLRNWFSLVDLAEGNIFAEVRGKANALKIARNLSRRTGQGISEEDSLTLKK
jgi:hypothetical protein